MQTGTVAKIRGIGPLDDTALAGAAYTERRGAYVRGQPDALSAANTMFEDSAMTCPAWSQAPETGAGTCARQCR